MFEPQKEIENEEFEDPVQQQPSEEGYRFDSHVEDKNKEIEYFEQQSDSDGDQNVIHNVKSSTMKQMKMMTK